MRGHVGYVGGCGVMLGMKAVCGAMFGMWGHVGYVGGVGAMLGMYGAMLGM